tara:strand:+ start:583 stop:1020 length:438 start_codon:yes stop_codon:yes gene_type:complete
MKHATEQELKVDSWTADYVTALNENFYNYQVRSYERMIDTQDSLYAQERLEVIKGRNPRDLYTWKVYKGRKYNKIVQREFDERSGKFRDGSVHAFVDKYTGEVYKPAGWANPAKHVRYDMRIIKERESLHNPDKIDWAGGHLYMR